MKRNLSRRLFLRGAAGVVVALPLLESFPRRQAEAQATPPFRFAIFVRQANGVQQKNGSEPERFWPQALGPLTTASLQAATDRTLSELAAYADKLLVVRGCKHNFGGSGCGHADGGLQCLTAARADGKNGNTSLAMGESIDNRIVRALKPAGSEPLNLYAGRKGGFLDDVLSYRGAKDRRAAETNPYNAYQRLFGLPDASGDAQSKLYTQRKSVNDLVREQMQALMTRSDLSSHDAERLKLHFDAIRDLEVKLGCHLDNARFTEIKGLDPKRATADENIETVLRMHMDIIALAMSCGLSPAVTLQIGSGNDGTQYMIDGVRQERFHHISHRINSDGSSGDPIPGAVDKHHKIDRLFAGYFKYLIDQLIKYPTPTGTLLDEGVAVWLNDLATGPPHSGTNIPYVCAGNAGGFLKTGQYVDAGDVNANRYVTHNKFLNTIGAAVGVKNASGGPLDDFGDPELQKGLIPQMLA
jgi:hypothetical protein